MTMDSKDTPTANGGPSRALPVAFEDSSNESGTNGAQEAKSMTSSPTRPTTTTVAVEAAKLVDGINETPRGSGVVAVEEDSSGEATVKRVDGVTTGPRRGATAEPRRGSAVEEEVAADPVEEILAEPHRGSGVVAVEEDIPGEVATKPIEGILSEPHRGLGAVAIEVNSPREVAASGNQSHRFSVSWGDLLKGTGPTHPLAVAIEEDSPAEPRRTSQVSFEKSGSFTLQGPVKEGSNEEIIPGPNMNVASILTVSELDISLTEHHRKGGGILASQRELKMDPEEFAAGCKLLQASARGDRDAMEALLKCFPNHKNFRDYDRRTALHVAASEGHLDICKFLVEEKGVRINRSDRWGGSPLDDAHRHRQEDVVKFLREHGASTGSLDQTTNLITAAAEGDAEEVKLLLSMNHNLQINAGDYDRRTALHLAAGEGRIEVVQLLCSAGANVNVEDRWGGRPLDDAERNRHDDVAQFLRNVGGKYGETHEPEDEEKRQPSVEEDNMRVEFEELEMIERIGAGAFGEIYKCRWRGTLVAAKCIKSAKIQKKWLSNHAMTTIKKRKGNVDDALQLMDEAELSESLKDEAISDFRQEIHVLRNLRHPHIVLLLAYSTTVNYEVMISELMKCSLLDIFKAQIIQGTRMPRKTQIVYAQQLAQGMNYLHTCKPPVIHRDLKPANLLIDHSGVLKISDFGLAKLRPDPKNGEVDQFVMTGETGSYRFMAVEVYRHEEYTETVDVYSYAMILYYLLAGRPPWATMNGLMAVKRAANDGDRPNIPRDWDERLSQLLQQCWDENPRARPPFSKILEVLDDYSRDVFKTDTNSVRQVDGPPAGAKRGCCVIL